jgi:hypothetical protein
MEAFMPIVGRKEDRASRQKRKLSTICRSLETNLSAYALSAGAAGVAVLACSAPAAASPVCTVSTATLSGGAATFALNPALQLVMPFNLAQTFSSPSTHVTFAFDQAFFIPNTPGAQIVVAANNLPANLASGASIGPAAKFGKGKDFGLLFTYSPWRRNENNHRGNFNFSEINYFGFEFSINRQTHYGWLRLQVTKGLVTHILGWGYETAADTPILAGACGSPKTAKITPASLGALALGAEALPLWRKE